MNSPQPIVLPVLLREKLINPVSFIKEHSPIADVAFVGSKYVCTKFNSPKIESLL